jgi:hypothetical protein
MEITDISNIDSTQFLNQDYSSKDESLLNSLYISKDFGLPEDKIEVHVISPDGTIIDSTYDFRNYKIADTKDNSSLYHAIELDPKSDLESFGYFRGQYDINYNFYREIFSSSLASQFYISEISSDRTEIKISSNNISYTDLGQSYLNYIAERNSRAFYSDFTLNFGDNDTYIGVNIALDNVNTNVSSLYIKLYEPLPTKISLKNTLWLVETLSDPFSFQVVTDFVAEEVLDTTPLRGPNVSIELNEKANLTTPYLNLSTLLNTSVSSSYQQLQSFLDENNIEITVDYTDFSNFVHFSSAVERVQNFQYKLSQIQSLQSDINSLSNLNISSSINYVVTSKDALQSRIDNIIQKFDGYEYFLYYESGSDSWPKSNSSKPYINYSTTSSQAKTWLGSTIESSIYYGGKLLEASAYDNTNNDYIWNNLPAYIKEDTQNSNLELFVAMMGQHYDYIWTYVRDITDLQVADNRVDYGISKDLVADTLRNFGMKLYTNSRNQDDIYASLLGVNSAGGFLPSTGSLLINNYVTASQYTIPDNDIVKETYKRIYHNLPYLLKTKGTRRGLSALINCFGIPDTIIKIKEYGGNKKDQDIIEQITPKFDYAFNQHQYDSYLQVPWRPSYKQFLNSGSLKYPDTFEFRFKLTSPSQSNCNIFESSNGLTTINVTRTTGSNANISLRFFDNGIGGDNFSPSINLPLYNNDWWNLNVTRVTGSLTNAQTGSNNIYTLTVGNKNSNGIQYLASSSIYNTGSDKTSYNKSNWNEIGYTYPGGADIETQPMIGVIQEFRYWIGSIPIDDFKDHILNPRSVSYNGVTGSYDNLIFRLPLGSELDNNLSSSNLTSVHPSYTASFISASVTSSIAIIGSLANTTYDINHETFLINAPNVGNFTEIDEKVRIADPNLIPGDVLTPYISIQKPEIYPYSTDLNVVEVAISPQDSIDADIIDQLGSFNIDDYIGDPRLAASGSYPALTDLRNFYFKKYSNKENIFDLIKLLSYFDNSLFKMIKDFVPAKSNLSTGLVIKPHILERNKIARHEPSLIKVDYSGSIETAFISGSNGLDKILNTNYTKYIPFTGEYKYKVYDYGNEYMGVTQSFTDKRELFNGELGGTTITAYTQSNENIIYELNNLSATSSQDTYNNFYRIPLNPILNNVSGARTTPQYLDVDYSYDPILPVNNIYLTSSLLSNLNDQHSFLNAPVQDSNYSLFRSITPRYNGSKLTGALYNTYSLGDISYGKDPVINQNSVKFAYFTEITSQSLTFTGRSNINLKYLIDSASNVNELTEANKNLFDVQDIFNRTDANIALENINQPSKQKPLNGLKQIYAGGFKYEPILQNYSNLNSTHSNIEFSFIDSIAIPNPSVGTQITSSINPGFAFSGKPFLTTPLSNNVPYDTFSNKLETILNSGITFPVTRTSPSDVEIRLRITGSVNIITKVSPPNSDDPVIFYTGYNFTGDEYKTSDLGYRQANSFRLTNGNVIGLQDWVGSVKVPAGKTFHANDYCSGRAFLEIIGPGASLGGFSPLLTNGACRGIDDFGIYAQDCIFAFTASSAQNTFVTSTPLVSLDTGSGTYSIVTDNGLTIIATYPIEGIITLPRGISNANIPLKNLAGAIGNISQTFTFNRAGVGALAAGQAKFSSHTSSFSTTNINSQYYFTQSPPQLYITGAFDRGFLSSSGTNASSSNNWYFERGNKEGSGSQFLLMTASYDLSRLYYDHYVQGGPYYGNDMIQILPTQSLQLGYQNITENFNLKRGDLIRFFNHDNEKFPFSSTFEREIVNIIPPIQFPGTGSNGLGSYDGRLVLEVSPTDSTSDIPNQACSNSPTGSTIGHILDFIILTKISDETNVIINHDKNPGQTSAGMLLPANISPSLKNQAGNIIKNLKSQNLI